jgi:hypothetical protein
MFLRVEIRKLLRVGEKDIDVMTFAMIELQHQRRAAPKRPMINYRLLRIDLSNDGTCHTKQPHPIRLTRHVAHAARG